MMDGRCDELRKVGYTNFFVSILIIIGILFSYLLQHYRIISRGTSEGISPYFVLLGVTSANSQFGNILVLPQSRADIGCCKEVSPFECAAGLLGIAQIGVQWICFGIILVLFLVFFRREDADVDEDELELDPDQPTWRTAIGVAVLCLVHGLFVVIISASFALGAPDYLGAWANVLGIMSAALAAIQYLPQIWITYKLKHAGSLSIPMMCVQTPGGFLFAGSLAARLGWAGWSSWGVYVLTAVMQGIVLTMAIGYEWPSHQARSLTPERPAYSRRTTPRGLPSPGPYSAHLQAYAETQEEIEQALDRESVQGLGENQPLLAPNGIGSSGVR
ncbi:ATP synthase F0 [Pseudomassariella vexata]|uniref:ATP synthase F0 n=1 Tax=Pseudomassariella vexata TaxID=1141098 RepID=A0A1Y2E124_9PEZI|nr:ATP synthase F0 [Pseudomassariella vexata]ORY65179.1 ATP synthase F0 [Pseudomassariella vexata]